MSVYSGLLTHFCLLHSYLLKREHHLSGISGPCLSQLLSHFGMVKLPGQSALQWIFAIGHPSAAMAAALCCWELLKLPIGVADSCKWQRIFSFLPSFCFFLVVWIRQIFQTWDMFMSFCNTTFFCCCLCCFPFPCIFPIGLFTAAPTGGNEQ